MMNMKQLSFHTSSNQSNINVQCEPCFWIMNDSPFSSDFGLYQLLTSISDSLASIMYSMFTSQSLCLPAKNRNPGNQCGADYRCSDIIN